MVYTDDSKSLFIHSSQYLLYLYWQLPFGTSLLLYTLHLELYFRGMSISNRFSILEITTVNKILFLPQHLIQRHLLVGIIKYHFSLLRNHFRESSKFGECYHLSPTFSILENLLQKKKNPQNLHFLHLKKMLHQLLLNQSHLNPIFPSSLIPIPNPHCLIIRLTQHFHEFHSQK